MAATPAINAWTNALRYTKNYGATADHRILLMNAANQRFHLAAPWAWTLGSLTETPLVDSTQDYAITSNPSDYLHLHQVRKWSGGQFQGPLQVVATLPATSYATGDPTQVAVYDNGGALTYRVYPTPTGQGTNPTVLIGDYKKKTTLITSGNESSADVLLFPDDYYYVYELFVFYYALKYANDPRAGTSQIQDGRVTSNGMLGEALAAIEEVRRREPMVFTPDGVPLR